jgi:hypothetical protein
VVNWAFYVAKPISFPGIYPTTRYPNTSRINFANSSFLFATRLHHPFHCTRPSAKTIAPENFDCNNNLHSRQCMRPPTYSRDSTEIEFAATTTALTP